MWYLLQMWYYSVRDRDMPHVWMSHVSRVNESYYTCERASLCLWVMAHVWTSHVACTPSFRWHVRRVNESYRTTHRIECQRVSKKHLQVHTWVTSHVWRSHITRVNKSYQTCERITSLVLHHLSGMSAEWISHITRLIQLNANESPKKIYRSTGHVSHVTRVKESCHTCKRVTPHLSVSHVTRVNQACPTKNRIECRCVTKMTSKGP